MSASAWAEGAGSLPERNPVSLHTLAHEPAMIGLRIECPVTGQVLTVALTPEQQGELRAGLSVHLTAGPADPHAGAVQRLEDWKARRAGQTCIDCDGGPGPCICQIAERPHLRCGLTYTEQLNEAMGGRR